MAQRIVFVSRSLIKRDLVIEFERKGLNYSETQMNLWARAAERIAYAAYNRGFIMGQKHGGKKKGK